MTAVNALQAMELQELHELYEILGIEAPGDLATGYTEIDAETKQRFNISTLDQVNWAFRKMAALTAQQAEIDRLAKSEIERITTWKQKQTAAIAGSLSFFEFLLSEYANNRRGQDEKYKGEKTPYGKIGFRKQQDAWDYKDEPALIQYLEENGHVELIRTKKETDKTALKKIVVVQDGKPVDPTTGEFIPGLEITTRPDAIDVKPEV